MNPAKKSLINWNLITGHTNYNVGASAGAPSSSSPGHYSAVLAGLSAESSPTSLPIHQLSDLEQEQEGLKKWRRVLGTSTGDSDPGRELSKATHWLISVQTEDFAASTSPMGRSIIH